jgi:hypothetical protein
MDQINADPEGNWNRMLRKKKKSVKVRLDRGETRSVQIGRGVGQGCCLSPMLFNLYSESCTKEAVEDFGDFKI